MKKTRHFFLALLGFCIFSCVSLAMDDKKDDEEQEVQAGQQGDEQNVVDQSDKGDQAIKGDAHPKDTIGDATGEQDKKKSKKEDKKGKSNCVIF